MKTLSKFIILLASILLLVGCSFFTKVDTQTTVKTSEIITEIKESKVKNLIIIIGDGMGPEQIKAGELTYNTTYEFTNWQNTLSNTNSLGDKGLATEVTDSAAGGTAIATGVVTINSYVGKDKDGNDLETILDYAKSLGKSTGIVTTDTPYGATPSDFSAHVTNRYDTDSVLLSQFDSNVDVIIGQYDAYITKYKATIESKGYTYSDNYNNASKISNVNKAYYMFNFEESSGDIKLVQGVQIALNILGENDNGFVLMIEEAHIDKNAHNNDFDNMVFAMNNLNDTVGYIISRYQNSNDLGIIITADHETGGLSVTKNEDRGKVVHKFQTSSHTSTYVPVYFYGFNVNIKKASSLKSSTILKNSDIFNISKSILE